MKNRRAPHLSLLAGCILLAGLPLFTQAQALPGPLGLFESQSEVGTVLHPGSAAYDTSTRSYAITGSGENMWGSYDEFHFLWGKASGDVTLTADISIVGATGNAHRKGLLMIRQSLEQDSAYVDAALHGDGLTAIQSRDQKGAITREVIAGVSAPKRLQIMKRGSDFYMAISDGTSSPAMSGGSFRIPFAEPFYVGLGVCAHDRNAQQTVVFSNVELVTGAPRRSARPVVYSTLETVALTSLSDRRATLVVPERIDAAWWSPDGAYILFNGAAGTRRVPPSGGAAEPASGTQGAELLTDGKYVYFNSAASGSMQIWRKLADGGGEEQVTSDELGNWRPHLSPDGRWMAFLSCQGCAKSIPPDADVTLRLMSLADRKVSVIAKLAGGRGPLETPAWSPDSKRLVFVSRQSVR